MLVERLDHVITSPIPGVLPVPAAMIKIIATKLKDENEGPVNGSVRDVEDQGAVVNIPAISSFCQIRPVREWVAAGKPEGASDRQAPTLNRAGPVGVRRGRSRACATQDGRRAA
jgi:hypothetical protein